MSFGFSPSDLITLVNLVTTTYRGWKNACGEYTDITGSLDSFAIILRRIQDEAQREGSPLSSQVTDITALRGVLSNPAVRVRELHIIVERYRSLSSKSRARTWQKITFGVKNLSDIRLKLNQHLTAISNFLQIVGLGALGRIEHGLALLPQIKHVIDAVAADLRAGRRSSSLLSSHSGDERGVWKQFRRDLISEGIKSSLIHEFRRKIKSYIRGLAENGKLEESSQVDGTSSVAGCSAARSKIQHRSLTEVYLSSDSQTKLQDCFQPGLEESTSCDTPPETNRDFTPQTLAHALKSNTASQLKADDDAIEATCTAKRDPVWTESGRNSVSREQSTRDYSAYHDEYCSRIAAEEDQTSSMSSDGRETATRKIVSRYRRAKIPRPKVRSPVVHSAYQTEKATFSGAGTNMFEDRHGGHVKYLSKRQLDQHMRRYGVDKQGDEEHAHEKTYQQQELGLLLTAANIRRVSESYKATNAVDSHVQQSGSLVSKNANDGIRIQSGDTTLHVYGNAKVEMRQGRDGPCFVIGEGREEEACEQESVFKALDDYDEATYRLPVQSEYIFESPAAARTVVKPDAAEDITQAWATTQSNSAN